MPKFRKILVLTILALLVASGVVATYLYSGRYDPIHPHTVIEQEDFDESTRQAFHYVKNEFVVPLQRYAEDTQTGRVFARSYSPPNEEHGTKNILLALESKSQGECLFITLQVDDAGDYIEYGRNLDFKIRYFKDTQKLLVKDDDGIWKLPRENQRLWSSFVTMDGEKLHEYFSSEVLDGPQFPETQPANTFTPLAQVNL